MEFGLTVPLVYISYIVAAMVAFGLYVGLPKEGRLPRQGGFLLAMALAAGVLVYLFSQLPGHGGEQVTFYVLAILGLAAAVRVVTHPKPVYSALYFVFVVIATAAMLVLVGAEFLGFALIIVYAGAILVTYVFVIMLSQQSADSQQKLSSILDYDRSAREPVWATLAGFMLMAVLAGMIIQRDWVQFDEENAIASAGRNTIELGRLLMTDLAISVELAAVLLMVAMVGAIAVARRRLPQPDAPGEHLPPGELGRRAKPF